MPLLTTNVVEISVVKIAVSGLLWAISVLVWDLMENLVVVKLHVRLDVVIIW